MAHVDITDFSEADLIGVFGARTFERGREYANGDRVVRVVKRPAESLLVGEVRGGDANPYSTIIEWSDGVVRGRCTCPVGDNCKHAAALVLVARARPAAPRSSRNVETWRRMLRDLVEHPEAAEAVEPRPLALQLLVHDPAEDSSRWASQSRLRLKARPVQRGVRGNWITTGATWRDMESRHHAHVSAHRAFMREVYSTAYDALGHAVQHGDGLLDLDYTSPDVWRVLDRAGDVGVALIDADGEESVTVEHEAAEFVIDMTRGSDGDLDLIPRARLGDEMLALKGGRAETIGTPAHGMFAAESGQIRLARFNAALPARIANFVRNAPVTVPAEHGAEFFDDYFPSLRRAAAVLSSDGSVEAPDVTPPRAALAVRYDGLRHATLEWGFAYARSGGEVHVPWGEPRQGEHWRDHEAEAQIASALALPMTVPLGPAPCVRLQDADVIVFTEQILPALRNHPLLDVTTSGAQPRFRAAASAPDITLAVSDSETGRDWFDLRIDISVEGEPVPFQELFVALAAGDSHFVLPSGVYIETGLPELAALRDLIAEARALSDDGTSLRVSRFQSDLWDEFAALGVVETQSQRWTETVEKLMGVEDFPSPALPNGFSAQLREYQQDGYAWLSFLYDHDLGGVLADDMGLGKTLQALALVCRAHEASPGARFLVVAPTSVVENWAREAARFAPGLDVITVKETTSKSGLDLSDTVGDAAIVVTSYALFRLDFDAYQALGFRGLFLDEAQFVKNHKAKTYQCARTLDVPFKVAITGTPLENSLMDLWSLLSIVAPGLYPRPSLFADWFAKPIENGSAPERLATLRRRIRPLMRRRTKSEVLSELPPKQEQVVDIELSAEHARLYQRQLQRERQKVLGLLAEVDKNRFEIFSSLTRLRQLALDPALVDPEHEDVGSAKIDVLVEQLTEIVAEGHQTLVFSQFTGYLKRIRTRLEAEGIGYAYLDGQTRRREDAIEEFRSGQAPVFLISLKAGGFGLNLTEADYCFVMDPWWNPAAEEQAVDRAHRIGQTNTVMVYRFVAVDTIEEKVMELKAHKRELFDTVMGGEGSLAGALTASDLSGLFAP